MAIKYIITPQTAVHHYLVKLVLLLRQIHKLTLPVWIREVIWCASSVKILLRLWQVKIAKTITSRQIDKK